jgi:NADH-quinone oxidoreductase subunit N
MIIYKLFSMMIFAWIITHLIRIANRKPCSTLFPLNYIQDFAGIAKGYLPAALALSAVLLGIGGIPPYSGFLAKLVLWNGLIALGEIFLSISILAVSLISIWIYLRFVKNIWFERKVCSFGACLE